MKLTKRLILAVLCIALVLTSTLLVVTACDQEETGFKVTVAEYNNQQGTVSVSSPAEGKLYDNGEKVTVTVTPATDYEVATFTVSGHDDATLNNEGKYEFEISSDTTVTVTFVQNQPEPTTFTVTVGSVQNGTVKLDPEKDAYTEGESVTVTVTPANGYEVTTFTVSGHDDATLNDEGKYTFQVTGNTTVSATFSLIPETVTVTVVEGEGTHIELSPEARKEEKTADGVVYTFVAGTEVTVSVTFDEGFVLDIFYVNKEEVTEELNEDNEYKFTVSENSTVEVVALFSFEQEFLGTWIDDENGSRIEITIDSVTIDGVEASKIVANEDDSYTVTVGTETYTVKKTEDGKLSVQGSNGTVEYRFRVTPWEVLIGEYSGVEDYSEDYGWAIELSITAEGLTFTLDGERTTLTPDDFEFVEQEDESYIYFPFELEGYTIYIYIDCLIEGKVVDFIGSNVYGYSTYFGAYLYSEDYVADFSDYYGTYTHIGGEDTITISESGIKMVLSGETYEVALDDIGYYPVESQVRSFEFEVEGIQVVLQQYGSTFGKLSMFFDDEYVGSFVSNEYQHSAWTQYVGTFNGEDEEGNEYEVVITEDEIVFKKNGQDQTITDIDFDRYLMVYEEYGYTYYIWLYQFDFSIGDVRWGLQQLEEDTDYNGLFLFFEGEEKDTTLCVVYRDQYQVVEDYSDYYGTYSNDDTTVVVSAEGITVTVEGVDVTATTEVEFGSNYDYDSESLYYYFSFVWNGKACILEVCDEGDAMFFAVDVESETSQVIVLVNSDYVVPDLSKDDSFIDDWSKYYETDDGLSTITITEEGEIQVVLGGQPVEDAQVVYYGEEGGLVIKLSGRTYRLLLIPHYQGDVIIFVDEESSVLVFTECDPVSDQSWEPFFGTWAGTASYYTQGAGYEYKDVVVVISDGAITLQIDGGEVMNAINPKLRVSYALVFTFTAGGVDYQMYDNTDLQNPYLALSAGFDMSASLYKLDWADLVGFYDNEAGDRDTDGEVCYITISATSITIQIEGSSPVTIEAKDIEFVVEENEEFTYSAFYFTYNEVDCMLVEAGEGVLVFYDVDDELYYITVYLNGGSGGDSDSPWPNFDGTWTGTTDEQEPRSVAIEIDGEYIFLTVGDDDGFEAINPSLVGSVLSFMCGGEEYMLTIVGDQLRVYNDTQSWEAMCDKFEQGGGDEGDWSEFDGVWEGSDAKGTVYKVEFNSVTGRIDVTIGEDVNIAVNVQVGEGRFGTKVTFRFNATVYIFEDDGAGGARFHDENDDVDVTLTRKGSDSGDGDEVDYSYYIGEYFSDDNTSDTKVEIVITKDSITIKIDGVEQNVKVVPTLPIPTVSSWISTAKPGTFTPWTMAISKLCGLQTTEAHASNALNLSVDHN